jgi:hypothetical protein
VTAEHDDNTATEPVRIHDRVDYALEISRYENIGERPQEGAEAVILAGRRSEFLGADLVWAALDRNGANLGEVRFWCQLRVVWPVGGVYDFR